MGKLHRMGIHMAEAEETVIRRVVLTDALYYPFNGHGSYRWVGMETTVKTILYEESHCFLKCSELQGVLN